MMNIATELTTNLLLLANAVLLGLAAIALVRFRHQARRFESFWNSPSGVSLADTQSLQANSQPQSDPQLEKRVAELQSVVKSLATQNVSKPEANEAVGFPIENAVRMAKHGASIDELIRSCGLNIGEAQLMRKLHGTAQVAAGR
jgi:hypothetical protein